MSRIALKRLRTELKEMEKVRDEFISAHPVQEDNLFEWEAVIVGQPDSPYENGRFKIRLVFPPNYPFRPPKVNFVTKIYHPNINPSGSICVDTLSGQWAPALSVHSLLQMLTMLMYHPNADDPLHGDAATSYKAGAETYKKKCQEWVRLHCPRS